MSTPTSFALTEGITGGIRCSPSRMELSSLCEVLVSPSRRLPTFGSGTPRERATRKQKDDVVATELKELIAISEATTKRLTDIALWQKCH
jgi:hypothetical protein